MHDLFAHPRTFNLCSVFSDDRSKAVALVLFGGVFFAGVGGVFLLFFFVLFFCFCFFFVFFLFFMVL